MTPCHFLFITIIGELSLYINNVIVKFDNDSIIIIIGLIFIFLMTLVFNEIIELNCFGLNYNLRNTIIKRASHEFMEIDDYERSTEESINDDLNSINSEESKESIINMSNNSNFSY